MDNVIFRYTVSKRNGDPRRLSISKINHALTKFWKIRDVSTGILEAVYNKKTTVLFLFTKVGKRRGYNYHAMVTVPDRPRVHSESDEMWRRLPSKFNELK